MYFLNDLASPSRVSDFRFPVPEKTNSFYIESMDVYQQILDEQYEIILTSLEARSKTPGFSQEQVQNELESLYKYDGLDMTGRGEILQARNEGSILAYQVFLMRWKRRREPVSPPEEESEGLKEEQ